MTTNDKRGLRPTIGVLAGWQAYYGHLNSFLDEAFRGVQAAARIRECNLLLACGLEYGREGFNFCSAWPVYSDETDFVPVGPWNTDGLIVIRPLLSEVLARSIHEIRMGGHPVLFVGVGEEGRSLVPDNTSGIRQAMQHLMAHGHRQIAFIRGNEIAPSDSDQRLGAYQAMVREHRLSADPRLVVNGRHSFEGGRRAMKQLLESKAPFSAVLASNDESAIGAMDFLRDSGRQVPKDVAVIGFDDRLEAVTQSPSLTTVHYPVFQAGYRVLEWMLEWIESGESALSAEKRTLDMRLVARRSCGCRTDIANPLLLEPERQPAFVSLSVKGHHTRAIVSAMTHSLSSEGMHLPPAEVVLLCQHIFEALMGCLQTDDTGQFRMALEEAMQRIGILGDDPYKLRAVIPALESMTPTLLKGEEAARLEALLEQARAAIQLDARRYYWQQVNWEHFPLNQIGSLTTRLLTAPDQDSIFEPLMSQLPNFHIEQAEIIFYEPQADDPVKYSLVRSSSRPDLTGQRFPTRQFPPPGMYADATQHQLVLLPLVIQTSVMGYVVFETTQLEICASIVTQLAAALKGAWLYREIEERHLAEEANRMKSSFLSSVSHELRTPLNLIVGLSDLILREAPSGSPQRRDLEQIHASAEHLGGMIRDVLDLASSQAGRLRLALEPLDLAESLQPAVEMGRELARRKNLAWEAFISPDLPGVMGDGARLRQVLLNLVGNAVKFTEQGRVALRIEALETELLVSVSDTGLGIPAAEREAIFDEFRQSERTAGRGYGGMGLGLAISKRLVEMHGGRIWVEPAGQEGAGCTFYFALPALPPDHYPVEMPRPETDDKVMLLVGEGESGRLMKERLTGLGYAVETLNIKHSAHWMGELLDARPAAVLLDRLLASEHGWEILRQLKNSPETRETDLFLYSLDQEQGRGALLELDYLDKPLGRMALSKALLRQGLLVETKPGGAPHSVILVVDDEPATLEMQARIVQAQSPDYEVLTARDGREALNIMRRVRPDLVLLDLMMPELDGFGVLEAMRQAESMRDIPVIILTAQVLTEADMARLNRGVTAVLGKGMFSLDETLAHLQDALSRRQKLGSQAQRLAREAMAYMHEHYAEPTITRAVLAHHVGVSDDYLTSCFHTETGLTPTAYLSRYRINQAKTLLALGKQTVEEVAKAVGFTDNSYFSRVFKKEVKVSPSDYRSGKRPKVEQ